MRKRKCKVLKKDLKTRCNAAAFAPVRVNVIHINTGRKTKQTWHLCEKHFDDFLISRGKDWEVIYHTKPIRRALVAGFQVLDGLEHGYRS